MDAGTFTLDLTLHFFFFCLPGGYGATKQMTERRSKPCCLLFYFTPHRLCVEYLGPASRKKKSTRLALSFVGCVVAVRARLSFGGRGWGVGGFWGGVGASASASPQSKNCAVGTGRSPVLSSLQHQTPKRVQWPAPSKASGPHDHRQAPAR